MDEHAPSQDVCLFGAAPDTANRGVSALFRCVIEGVGSALPDSRLLVFDNALGVREDSTTLASGARLQLSPGSGLEAVGATTSRRIWRPWLPSRRSGVPSERCIPSFRVLDQCDAILDVSGGDSFSDIYGSHRFWSIIRPKLIAKRRGIPLVLLPQTYGPFRGDRATTPCAERRSWLPRWRGPEIDYSFEALKSLLGSDFDESRHREGVDMAFNCEPSIQGRSSALRSANGYARSGIIR